MSSESGTPNINIVIGGSVGSDLKTSYDVVMAKIDLLEKKTAKLNATMSKRPAPVITDAASKTEKGASTNRWKAVSEQQKATKSQGVTWGQASQLNAKAEKEAEATKVRRAARLERQKKEQAETEKLRKKDLKSQEDHTRHSGVMSRREEVSNRRAMLVGLREAHLPVAMRRLAMLGSRGAGAGTLMELGGLAGVTGVGYAAKKDARLEDMLIEAIQSSGGSVSGSLENVTGRVASLAGKSKTGQTMEKLAEALQIYTEHGLSLEDSMSRVKQSGRVATAAHSTASDAALSELAFKSLFGIQDKDVGRAWNIVGNQSENGSFKLKDFAGSIPGIGEHARGLKLTGESGLAYIAASLQSQSAGGVGATQGMSNWNSLAQFVGSSSANAAIAKHGGNMDVMRREAERNAATGGPNIMELFTQKVARDLAGTSEAYREDYLREMMPNEDARAALKTQIAKASEIKSGSSNRIAGGNNDAIGKPFEDAMIANARSFDSMKASAERFGRVAGQLFKPILDGASSLLEKVTDFTVDLTTAHPQLAKIAFGVFAISSAFGALRMLGGVSKLLGFATAGKWLARLPSITGMAFRALTWMSGGVITGITKMLPFIGKFSGALVASIGRSLTFIAEGVISLGASALPFLGKFGGLLMRGISTLFSTLGPIVLVAIAGWGLGNVLGNLIAEPLATWWQKFTGLKAQIDAMNKPATSHDMDATRLSDLTGEGGQEARRAAAKKWKATIASEQIRVAALGGLPFKSDANKIEEDQAKANLHLAEGQLAAIQGQLLRGAQGGIAIGNSPHAIAAATARIAGYDKIVKGGVDVGDTTVAEARQHATELRAQLAQAKAKGAELAGKSNFTNSPVFNLTVSGNASDSTIGQIEGVVQKMFDQANREIARNYRGVVSTGALGE